MANGPKDDTKTKKPQYGQSRGNDNPVCVILRVGQEIAYFGGNQCMPQSRSWTDKENEKDEHTFYRLILNL